MSFLTESIDKDEKIIFKTRQSLSKLLWTNRVFMSLILIELIFVIIKINFSLPSISFFICGALAILSMIPSLFSYFSVEYFITTKKLISERGIIAKQYSILYFSKIVDTDINISLLDKALNTGTVLFYTANDTEGEMFKNIKRPQRVLRYVNSQ